MLRHAVLVLNTVNGQQASFSQILSPTVVYNGKETDILLQLFYCNYEPILEALLKGKLMTLAFNKFKVFHVINPVID